MKGIYSRLYALQYQSQEAPAECGNRSIRAGTDSPPCNQRGIRMSVSRKTMNPAHHTRASHRACGLAMRWLPTVTA